MSENDTSFAIRPPPALIGFYVVLPVPVPIESPNELQLLDYILARPLRALSILREDDPSYPHSSFLVSFCNQFIGKFVVDDWRLALGAIRDELQSARLLEKAQLARLDFAEDFWRDVYPSMPATPYAQQWENSKQWPGLLAQRLETFRQMKGVLDDNAKLRQQVDQLSGLLKSTLSLLEPHLPQ